MARAAGVWLVMDVFNGDYIDEVGTAEGWREEYLRKNRETTQVQRDNFRRAVELGVPLPFGRDSVVSPHGITAPQFAYMLANGQHGTETGSKRVCPLTVITGTRSTREKNNKQ